MLRAFSHPFETCCDIFELVRMPGRNIAPVWPNDYKIMQHSQMLREKFDHFQHFVTCLDKSQHGGQTQQYYDVLRWNAAIVWPSLNMIKKPSKRWICIQQQQQQQFIGIPI